MSDITQLRGNVFAKDPRLGRVPEFDERSRQYPVRALLPEKPKIKGRSWIIGPVYDQGIKIPNVTRGWDPSACTGFSAGYDLLSTPAPAQPAHISPKFCFELYRLGQTLDEWAGENYEGSSVLGVCKALAKLGFVGSYHWAFGIDDVLASLSNVSGVVVGTDWQESMFYPQQNGLLRVEGDSRETAGGHAYFLQSIITSKLYMRVLLGRGEPLRDCPLLRIHQSWGNNWGVRGDAFIWADDMERLLRGITYPGEARITTAAFKQKYAEVRHQTGVSLYTRGHHA